MEGGESRVIDTSRERERKYGKVTTLVKIETDGGGRNNKEVLSGTIQSEWHAVERNTTGKEGVRPMSSLKRRLILRYISWVSCGVADERDELATKVDPRKSQILVEGRNEAEHKRFSMRFAAVLGGSARLERR